MQCGCVSGREGGGGAKAVQNAFEIHSSFNVLLHPCACIHPFTFPLSLSSSLSFAGGKTPDPNKRSYADVITEARLRAEEVSACTVDLSCL